MGDVGRAGEEGVSLPAQFNGKRIKTEAYVIRYNEGIVPTVAAITTEAVKVAVFAGMPEYVGPDLSTLPRKWIEVTHIHREGARLIMAEKIETKMPKGYEPVPMEERQEGAVEDS